MSTGSGLSCSSGASDIDRAISKPPKILWKIFPYSILSGNGIELISLGELPIRMRWEPVPTTYGLANKMISLLLIRTQTATEKNPEPLGGTTRGWLFTC
jgi:hypothetical protein